MCSDAGNMETRSGSVKKPKVPAVGLRAPDSLTARASTR